MTTEGILVWPLDGGAIDEVAQVARRMRETLIEVLGEEQGDSMYTMEWLVQRVHWHLDADQVRGQVFVAENTAGEIVGHTIVRVEVEEDGSETGLFSTTYVEPLARRSGVATCLVHRGEKWLAEQGMAVAVTYTDVDNFKLQNLYLAHGYAMQPMPNRFVKLSKCLENAG